MNNNILNKILLAKSLEEWKDKIAAINQEYHKWYKYYDYLVLYQEYYDSEDDSKDSPKMMVGNNINYRDLNIYYPFPFILSFHSDERVARLPKRYIFSSGMRSLKGFK